MFYWRWSLVVYIRWFQCKWHSSWKKFKAKQACTIDLKLLPYGILVNALRQVFQSHFILTALKLSFNRPTHFSSIQIHHNSFNSTFSYVKLEFILKFPTIGESFHLVESRLLTRICHLGNLCGKSENRSSVRDCGMAKSSEPIKWQDSNTPTLTPYKAFSGALLLWGANVRGAAGSDKSKHLEYTAYFWKGNINNLAHFSWVITLSPPDLCFYPTGGLYKPCFCSNPWRIQV